MHHTHVNLLSVCKHLHHIASMSVARTALYKQHRRVAAAQWPQQQYRLDLHQSHGCAACHTEAAHIVPCQHIAFAQFPDALLCCSFAHPLILNVAWVLLVPVHDAANIGLDHTDASLRCSLSLDEAAMQNKAFFDHTWKTLLA